MSKSGCNSCRNAIPERTDSVIDLVTHQRNASTALIIDYQLTWPQTTTLRSTSTGLSQPQIFRSNKRDE